MQTITLWWSHARVNRSGVIADIRQVAAEAGVSTATVSRVLSGKGPASRAATTKVRAAAERLGYTPSASASSLRTDRSMIIGVLVPNLANPVFLPLLRAVEHLAHDHGYAIIVADTQRSAEVERRQLDRLSAQRIDALVVAGRPRDPAHLARLAESGLIVIDESGFPDMVDRMRGSLGMAIGEAVDHLAALGHQQIAFVARGRRLQGRAAMRWDLIEAACRQRGVHPTAVLLGRLGGAEQPDPVAMASYLAGLVGQGDGPSVLWSNSHMLAPAILHGLAVADIGLPADVSFLTFGDSPWAAAYRPAIAVVTGDLGAVGAVLARSVLHRLGAVEELPAPSMEPDVYRSRHSVGPIGTLRV